MGNPLTVKKSSLKSHSVSFPKVPVGNPEYRFPLKIRGNDDVDF